MKVEKSETITEEILKYLKRVISPYSLKYDHEVKYYLIMFENENEIEQYLSSCNVLGGKNNNVNVGEWNIVAEHVNAYNYHHRTETDYIILYNYEDEFNSAIKVFNEKIQEAQNEAAEISCRRSNFIKFIDSIHPLSDPTHESKS